MKLRNGKIIKNQEKKKKQVFNWLNFNDSWLDLNAVKNFEKVIHFMDKKSVDKFSLKSEDVKFI